MAEKILSVHIEKAGGTSLEDFYKTLFGPKNVLIYNPRLNTIVRSSAIRVPRSLPLVSAVNKAFGDQRAYLAVQQIYSQVVHRWSQQNQIQFGVLSQQNFSILHGHFTADQFDQCLEVPLKIVTLRDPFDRMQSQFNHWKRVRGNVDWRITIPYDDKFAFDDYAMLNQLQNYQTQALGGKPIESFDLVGTTDKLDKFAEAIVVLSTSKKLCDQRAISQRRPKLLRLNESPIIRKEEISPSFRHKFSEWHQEDYKLFRWASSH